MKTTAPAWLLALVMGVLGCELSAELGTYAAPDGEATGTDTGGSSGGSPDEGDEGRGEAGSMGNGDGDGDGDAGDGDAGDGDTGAGICMIDGSESPCRICLEHLCCDQLENCDVELGCFCMLECLAQSDAVTCAMTCTPGLAYFQLLQCRAMSCGTVCE